MAAVTARGEELIEGERAGHLEGFNSHADADARDGGRDLLAAANKALRRDIGDRVRRFMSAPDEDFAIDTRGLVRWQNWPVAKLVAGDTPLTPRVEILPADLLEPRHRDDIRRRLQDWLDAHIARTLAPLVALRDAPLSGSARGLAFALVSNLGCVARGTLTDQLASLTGAEHQALTAAGVHIGQAAIHVPALRGHDVATLRALLWAVSHNQDSAYVLTAIPQGRSLSRNAVTLPAEFMAACSYLPAGPLFVRADRLEGLATRLRGLARRGPFAATDDLAAAVGARAADLASVLAALGYRAMPGMVFVPRPAAKKARKIALPDAHSPFASLHKLKSR
jgi:ATP-dependent RNA helicase SUPV3L1/SUV3